MNTTMQDVIEREVTVRATKERVFRAITDPSQLIAWFPDKIEGKVEVGANPIFEFDGHGKHELDIVSIDPHDYFAYRWDPGCTVESGTTSAKTLVEFTLQTVAGGTLVKVKESGFASLPLEIAAKKVQDNTDGWTYMLDRLEKLLA